MDNGMKKIGITFGDELTAAGLAGLSIGWGGDGAIAFGVDITAAQQAAVLAVYEAHNPDKSCRKTVMKAINVERDRRKSAGLNCGSKWYHSDADSRIQYLGLKDKARDLLAEGGAMTDPIKILGQSVQWKTMGGLFVNVTAQLAFDIVAAVGDLDAQLFTVAESHKVIMESSADPASYDFSGGWPQSFGE